MIRPLLLLLLITNLSQAQTYHQSLENAAQENNLIGMSVVITCREELVDTYHYGLANIDQQLSINDDTKYRIASISKTVTAIALMHLYEQESYDLDADISDYLGYEVRNPNFPDKTISIRMLLSHTSSLQDGSGYNNFLGATYGQTPVPTIAEVLLSTGDYYTSNMWRTEEPGTYFAYSNINFGLAATLLENISGQRFDQYVKTNLLDPLDIDGSFTVNDLNDINEVAVLYRNAIPQSDNYNGNYPSPLDPADYTIGDNAVRFSPQGGLRISPLDLSKIMRMLANWGSLGETTILDSTTVSLMQSAHWTNNGSNGDNYFNLFNEWGLGVHSTTNTAGGDIVIPSVNMLGHPGEAYGLISDMYYEPENGFGLIFMTNGYYGTDYYSFGNNSAFYSPEEEVFTIINEFIFEACPLVTSTNDLASEASFDFDYLTDSHSLQFSDWSTKEGYVYDMLGRELFHFQTNSLQQSLPSLKPAIYLISVKQEEGWRTKKIMVASH